MRCVLLLPLVLGTVLLPACGGGGGSSPVHTLEAPIYESLSGTVANDAPGGLLINRAVILVGDVVDDTTRRACYTFITADLPPGARVHSAILTTRQYVVAGLPYAHLLDVLVDHTQVGSTLDAADYSHVQWALDIGTLSTTTGTGWPTLDVTEAVRTDVLAGRHTTTLTLRLRFRSQTDIDGEPEYMGFSAPNWPEDDRRASLVIRYSLP